MFISAYIPGASPAETEQPKTGYIEGIEVSDAGERSLLSIKSSAPIGGNYTVFKSPDPPKVTIEMPDVEAGGFGGPIEAGDKTVKRVETFRMNGKGVRVEAHLASLADHEVKVEGNTLMVYFAKAEAPQEVPQPVAEPAPAVTEAPPVEKVEEAPAPVAEPAAEPKKEEKAEAPKKSLKITGIKIRRVGKFTAAEITADGEIAAYNAFSLKAPYRVVVDIENAREIATGREVKAVSPHIKSARLGRYDDRVRVVFDYKGDIGPYDVVKKKDRVVIFFGRRPAVTVAKVERPKEEPAKPEAVAAEVKPEVAPAPEAKAEEIPEVKVEAPKEEVPKVAEVKPEVAPVPEAKVEAKAEEIPEVKVEAPKEEVPKVAEVKPEVAPVPEAKIGVPEKAEVKAKVEEKPAMPVKEEVPVAPKEKVYTGQKVTLEFKDADMKNIFRVIAEVSSYNMIIDPAVTGKLTLRLVNVPWDQALDILLETNNLGMKKVGNVIRVLPLAVIKKEEEEKLAAKKAAEKLEDLVTRLIPVSYAKAPDIASRIKSVMSERGTAEVDARTNTIILKDIRKSVDDALKLVASLDTPTRQVMIEARIVSANTRFARDLGIQWGTGYTAGAATGNPTGYYFPNSYNINAGGGGAFALNPPAAGSVGAGTSGGGVVGISFGSINDTLNLDLRLSALESQGWGKVISSPKIVTLDNKEASIQQGFSIPYETTSASGTQTQFVDASLNLTVTPQVTADGRLMMKIKASKNAPSDAFRSAGGVPSIDKKEASTEILVRDGDTTVIGGIYETSLGESETFIPFLGKIPLIGWLFKSKSKSETKTELLIFITPRIVQEKPA